jgi:hypothetical protein
VNIVKLQNDLKDLSDKQLLDSMQAGSAPQYLVLSEMQRRKKMREEANSQPQMPSSVAEETVQGLAGMPQTPQVAMASGGIVGFAGGRSVDREVRRMVESGNRQYDEEGNVILGPEVEVAGKREKAVGANQILPSTAMKPGYEAYGATNIFDLAEELGVNYGGKRDEETAKLLLANEMINNEFADRYQTAMANRFGDDKATTAYHAGPGRTARNKIGPATEDYVAKSEALKNQIMKERGLDTQSAAEGIAALGEGKMTEPDDAVFTAAEWQALRKHAKNIGADIVGRPKEKIDWSQVPGNSSIRGMQGTGYDDTGLAYDQGGAYDVQDSIEMPNAGGSSVWPNSPEARAEIEKAAFTDDKGLMALAPKTPYGRPRGLLEGEKIVNAAEPATAESYELIEKPVTNEYGDYLNSLDSGPSLEAQMAMSTPEPISGPGFDEGDTGPMTAMMPYEASAMAAEDPAEKARLLGIHKQWQSGVEVPVEGETGWRYNPEANVYFNPQGQLASPPVGQFAGTTKDRFEKKAGTTFGETKAKNAAAADDAVNRRISKSQSEQAATDPLTQLYEEIKAERAKKSGPDMSDFLMRTGAGMMEAGSKTGSFLGATGSGLSKGISGLDEAKKAAAKERSDSLSEMTKLLGARELSGAKAVTARYQQAEGIRKMIDDLKTNPGMPPASMDADVWQQGIDRKIKQLESQYNALMNLPSYSGGLSQQAQAAGVSFK